MPHYLLVELFERLFSITPYIQL